MKSLTVVLFSLALGFSSSVGFAKEDGGKQKQQPQQQQQLMKDNMAVFFEIPAMEMDRAIKFYNEIFQLDLKSQKFEGGEMAPFPMKEGAVSGALSKAENMVPSSSGPVVYLNGGKDLQLILDRVEAAGGKILTPKTQIEGVGFYALFLDTEGNRLGLFSMN